MDKFVIKQGVKARMMFTSIAFGLLRTDANIATPCSVKAYGIIR